MFVNVMNLFENCLCKLVLFNLNAKNYTIADIHVICFCRDYHMNCTNFSHKNVCIFANIAAIAVLLIIISNKVSGTQNIWLFKQ